MSWEAWYVATVIAALVVALARDMVRPDAGLMIALGAVLVAGIVPAQEAFAGFANPAVVTLASLFVLAAGVQASWLGVRLDRWVLPSRGRRTAGLLRIVGTTALLSAFMNNTPVVAVLMPRVRAWAARHGMAGSWFLIPLSYAAIAGGMVTLIGTSTNIVVAELVAEYGGPTLGMFDFAWSGLPVLLVILLFFGLGGGRLLPARSDTTAAASLHDVIFEVAVVGAPVAGRTVGDAGLRDLGRAFLAHVRRAGVTLIAEPDVVLERGDVLVFTGDLDVLDQLLHRSGFGRPHRLDEAEEGLMPLYEAVLADTSSLVGRSLREVGFRERFGGVVLAIRRSDRLVRTSLGRLKLRAGDLLVIEAPSRFEQRLGTLRTEFLLVASHRQRLAVPVRFAVWPPVILVAMLVVVAMGWVPVATAAFVAALLVIFSGAIRQRGVRDAVDFSVLVMIGAALGLGQAVERTGLSADFAGFLESSLSGAPPVLVLAALYVATNVLTELITHKASVVLMIPVALKLAAEMGLAPEAAALAVAAGGAASLMTPVGYQTNAMVYAAGGYRYTDFLKVGLPLSLLAMAAVVAVLTLVFG